MKNNNHMIQINIKSIVLIIVVIFGLVASLFLLNSISERRRYNRFKELNEKTVTAFHLNKLDSLTINLDIHDTISIEKIKEQLSLLRRDIDLIDNCELLIPSEKGIIKIGRYNSEIEIIYSLPLKEGELIKLLNQNHKEHNDLEKQIYKITEGKYELWTMVKLENCFLITINYKQ